MVTSSMASWLLLFIPDWRLLFLLPCPGLLLFLSLSRLPGHRQIIITTACITLEYNSYFLAKISEKEQSCMKFHKDHADNRDSTNIGTGAMGIGKDPPILMPGEEDPIWVPRRLTRILKDASMDDDVPDEPADALDEPTAGEDGAKMGDPVSVSEFDASPA
ncbi:hypothetical protein STEG23_025526 [Scotinomys teguina]